MLPLLRALQDDGSAYVRRSVANHLNDIAKDHPAILAQWLQDHLPEASAERRALLKHASRTLGKKHSLKPITTRRYYPGKHRITVQVNGRDVAEASFDLRD